jgi:hypothetical protein
VKNSKIKEMKYISIFDQKQQKTSDFCSKTQKNPQNGGFLKNKVFF